VLQQKVKDSDTKMRIHPTLQAFVNITLAGNPNVQSFDVCTTLKDTSDLSKCFTSRRDSDNVTVELGLNQQSITKVDALSFLNIEKYSEKTWDCRLMTCSGDVTRVADTTTGPSVAGPTQATVTLPPATGDVHQLEGLTVVDPAVAEPDGEEVSVEGHPGVSLVHPRRGAHPPRRQAPRPRAAWATAAPAQR
jgi:hypothetical protein